MHTAANIIVCTGKHNAEPIGANFLMDMVSPSGSRTFELLVAKNGISQDGGNTFLTNSIDRRSEAEDKSSVSISPV
jgi:hypothetical protein